MSGHTQGTWRIDHDGSNWMVVTDDYPDMVDVRGFGGMPKDEALANARLISASPDLLEALEACRSILENAGLELSDEYQQASAAIAKARGTPC